MVLPKQKQAKHIWWLAFGEPRVGNGKHSTNSKKLIFADEAHFSFPDLVEFASVHCD